MPQTTSQTPQLHEGLNFTSALSIVLGRIIGSGIFRTPGPIFLVVCGLDLSRNYSVAEVPVAQLSVGLFVIVFLICGIATYLGALCYAELVSLLPRSGGPYAYLKAAYPEYITFLRGWAMFFVSETASIVAVAVVFSEYLSMFIEEKSFDTLPQAAVALFLIWIFTLANCFGVVISGILQNILSFLKVFCLFGMAFLLWGIGGDSSHLQEHIWPKEWSWVSLLAIGQAMRYAFFAYSGWEGATYVAEEVRKPQRNLPLSLFCGITLVMIVYIAVILGYVSQLGPVGVVVAGKNTAPASMGRALGGLGIYLLATLVMLSTGGNMITQILVKARTWHAMARDGLFFDVMARLQPRFQTPNNALLLQAAWASVLLVWVYSFGNSYETLIDFFSFTSTLFNILTFIAVLRLRKIMPDSIRKFRTPWLPLVLAIVLLIQFSFLLITLYDRPLASITGILLTLSGLFYYRYKRHNLKHNLT